MGPRRDLADELLQAKVRSRLFGGDHAPRLGRLVILDKLGAGAMGTVYAAYDPKLDRKVAVKVMHHGDPGGNARVLREARALARLAHPNIVTIHDAGEDDDGVVYVVMELATGVPLRAWIDSPERTWREVVRVMAEVAAGLAAAHRAGIVHRDIKPENILVGERTRLVDFGLAVEPQASTEPQAITEPDHPASRPPGDRALDPLAATDLASVHDGGAGTPAYMAPEVLAGGEASPASDQFSFAVTLFEALHGERSHTGTTRAELHAAALLAGDPKRSSKRPSVASPSTPTSRRAGELDKTIDERSEARRGEGASSTVLSTSIPAPRIRPGRAVGAVPAWIDAVVRRALAASPAERFPSMDALHAELTRDRTRRRRALALVGVAVVAGTGIGVLAFRAGGGEPAAPIAQSCDGRARVDAVWNPRTLGVIRERFGDTPWTTPVVTRLQTAADAWDRSFETVCEATRIRGEQSDRLLELRMRCLDRSLARLHAFVDALQGPIDRRNKIEAVGAIDDLPPAAACETILDDPTLAVPADPRVRAEAAAIEQELDRAWASYALGRYTAASTQATALSARVAELDLPGLHAAVLLLGAAVEGRIGDGHDARTLLERAAVLAARAKAPELELQIWTRLFRHELFADRADRVLAFGAVGETAAIRAGRDGGEIHALIGEAQRDLGLLTDAKANLAIALATKDPLRADQRAMIETNLGSVELALGNSTAASELYERALERARGALGDSHPTLAIHYDRLAAAARARGKLRDALALHDRSRDLRIAAFGPDDRAVATALFQRATTLLEAGRLAEARTDATAALELRGKIFGKWHARLAEIQSLLGDIELAAGNLAGANTRYDLASTADPDITPVGRTVALARALGVRPWPSPAGPFAAAQLLPALAAVGWSRERSEPWRLEADIKKLEPFSVARVAMIALELAVLPRDRAMPLLPAVVARYRKAGTVDASISLAVGDAVVALGDRATAATAYAAALAVLADEPSRERLHALRGLAATATGEQARTAAAAVAPLLAALPELPR